MTKTDNEKFPTNESIKFLKDIFHTKNLIIIVEKELQFKHKWCLKKFYLHNQDILNKKIN